MGRTSAFPSTATRNRLPVCTRTLSTRLAAAGLCIHMACFTPYIALSLPAFSGHHFFPCEPCTHVSALLMPSNRRHCSLHMILRAAFRQVHFKGLAWAL